MDGEIAVSGDVLLHLDSGAFVANVDGALTPAVEDVADQMAAMGRVFAPKGKTLELTNSIQGLLVSATSAVAVATAPHAIFQEKGAGAHIIPSLLSGGWKLLAGDDFGPVWGPVEHPGNPATHFLEQAGDAVSAFVPRILAEHLP